jgi:hypothetical protein
MTEFNGNLTPSFIRFKEVTTALDSDSLFIQPFNSGIPKKILITNLSDEDNGVLFGGTSADEDVYKITGGVGASINSDIYNL